MKWNWWMGGFCEVGGWRMEVGGWRLEDGLKFKFKG